MLLLYRGQMRATISTFFAILAAMVAVFAIKRGAETWFGSLGGTTQDVLLFLVVGFLLGAGAWLWILRPAIERRKQAQDPGLRERAVRDTTSDRLRPR